MSKIKDEPDDESLLGQGQQQSYEGKFVRRTTVKLAEVKSPLPAPSPAPRPARQTSTGLSYAHVDVEKYGLVHPDRLAKILVGLSESSVGSTEEYIAELNDMNSVSLPAPPVDGPVVGERGTGKRKSQAPAGGTAPSVSRLDIKLYVDNESDEYFTALKLCCPAHLMNKPCRDEACRLYHICHTFRVTGDCASGGVKHRDENGNMVIHTLASCKCFKSYVPGPEILNAAQRLPSTTPRTGNIFPCERGDKCPRCHDYPGIRYTKTQAAKAMAMVNRGLEEEAREMKARERAEEFEARVEKRRSNTEGHPGRQKFTRRY